MKNFIYFSLLSIVWILVSCNAKKLETKAYIFELSGYTYMYTPFGDKVVTKPILTLVQEFSFQNEDIDSIINTKINEYNNAAESMLKKYYNSPILYSSESELFKIEAKKSAMRSIIGKKVFFITMSDSVVDKYGDSNMADILEEYIQKGSPELQNSIGCYILYDGTELNYKLLLEMEEKLQ